MLTSLLGSLVLLAAANHPSFQLIPAAKATEFDWTVGNAYLAPDGYNRSTVVVNGQFPGPLISVNKGDNVTVKVTNALTDSTMRRSTSIHWHGLRQPRLAYNDGPSFVTQCPIAPDNEYTYSIDVSQQSGTYWYHSHLSSQYLDGLRGPIVIYDPEDPNIDLYDVDDDTTVIVLADWFHDPAPTLSATYLSLNNTADNEVVPKSGTINGVGRESADPAPARPVFNVESGKRYRFRIINVSAIARFDFQIANHTLTIIEADGEPHEPLTVDRFTIYPGMRFSVVVNANQTVDNYWIHTPMTVRVPNPAPTNWTTDSIDVNAVLHYEGADDAEPSSDPPTTLTGTNLDESELVPVYNATVPGEPYIGGADKVFNLTFANTYNETLGNGFTINGIRYIPPSVPTLLQILSGSVNASDFSYNQDTQLINYGDVVEISIAGLPNHPFHLHGHTFHVVKGATGSANFVNPQKRDVTPTAGATPIVIRFVADNPGPWFLHCHIDLHLEGGLAMVFAEDPTGIISGNQSVVPSQQWQDLCTTYNALDSALQ